jgi:hypothetical protein
MRIVRSLVAASFLVLTAGCTVTATTEPDVVFVDDGTFTIDWSIDEAQDPFVCSDFDADAIEVTIYDHGSAVGTAYDDICEDFVLTVSLEPGTYDATAVLLDVNGDPITTTIDIAPFDVFSDTDFSVSVDFPPDSFF